MAMQHCDFGYSGKAVAQTDCDEVDRQNQEDGEPQFAAWRITKAVPPQQAFVLLTQI